MKGSVLENVEGRGKRYCYFAFVLKGEMNHVQNLLLGLTLKEMALARRTGNDILEDGLWKKIINCGCTDFKEVRLIADYVGHLMNKGSEWTEDLSYNGNYANG